MKPVIHPCADPSCAHCGGRGLRVVPDGEVAVARPCSCVSERVCPVCEGRGWRRVSAETNGALTACDCRLAGQVAARFDLAKVPARMAHCSFANFRVNPAEQGEAYATSQALSAKYRNGEVNRGFVLWGPVGRGKTHLLVAAVRHLALERSVRCRFVEFSHLLSALKGRFDKGEGAAALIDDLVAVEVLAIDELGKGLLTEWELTVVDEIVIRRYNAARTILATTNYAPGPPTGVARPNLADVRSEQQPTLSDRVGERVYSRLIEMCELRRVGGKDWRATPQNRW